MMSSTTPTETSKVNLKLQLRKPAANADDEHFRAQLSPNEDAAFTLAGLKELLSDVIPVTQTRNYRLLWADADGDEVTIGNDEALNLALKEMTGPVYKIVVSLLKPGQGPLGPRERGDPHPGVSCDSCERDITGFRYKCVVCPDYDLCARCETKGLHAEHNMIRMATPTAAYPKHFFRRICKLHDKMAANKEKRAALKEHKETHEAAHTSALEASGVKAQPGTATTTETITKTTKETKDGGGDSDSSDDDDLAEEPSLDEVIAQLSTHGADYLRNLGCMISTTLDTLMVEEEAGEEKEKRVEEALEKMKELGYTNENDWLRQLLMTVDGDVDKAMATLGQPKKDKKQD